MAYSQSNEERIHQVWRLRKLPQIDRCPWGNWWLPSGFGEYIATTLDIYDAGDAAASFSLQASQVIHAHAHRTCSPGLLGTISDHCLGRIILPIVFPLLHNVSTAPLHALGLDDAVNLLPVSDVFERSSQTRRWQCVWWNALKEERKEACDSPAGYWGLLMQRPLYRSVLKGDVRKTLLKLSLHWWSIWNHGSSARWFQWAKCSWH